MLNSTLLVKDCTLYYQLSGTDKSQNLVFIHGFPFDHTMWAQQVDFFKSNYNVLTYDVRGHGRSEMGYEPFSVDLFADDLIFILDELQIEKAIICGLSMGGYIALRALQIYPERFSGLILCDTTCKADTDEAKQKREQTKKIILQKGILFYTEQSLPNLFSESSFQQKSYEILQVKKVMSATPVDTLQQTLTALAQRNDTCSVLQNLPFQTLILVGEQDKITPVEAAKFMSTHLTDFMLCTISNAGHVSNLEQPNTFNRLVSAYLTHLFGE